MLIKIMKKEIITTSLSPAAIGPYSQATKFGNLIFTSGIIPVDPNTGEIVKGGIEEQTQQVMTSLQNLVEASGSSLENIIKTTVFIKDMNDFSKINTIYAKYFPTNPPSRSCVEVARLPKDVLIEIEAICYIY